MKWSEQMRELLSVDENFNQLEFDIDRLTLSINGEFIAKPVIAQTPVVATSTSYAVSYEDYNKIIKKYPFFTDVKFLLNCIFKIDFHFSKAREIYDYDEYLVIQNYDSTKSLIIYTSPQPTP